MNKQKFIVTIVIVSCGLCLIIGCSKKNSDPNEIEKAKAENAALKAKIQQLEAINAEQQKKKQQLAQTKVAVEPNVIKTSFVPKVTVKPNIPPIPKKETQQFTKPSPKAAVEPNTSQILKEIVEATRDREEHYVVMNGKRYMVDMYESETPLKTAMEYVHSHPELSDEIRAAILYGKAIKGMTRGEISVALNKPYNDFLNRKTGTVWVLLMKNSDGVEIWDLRNVRYTFLNDRLVDWTEYTYSLH